MLCYPTIIAHRGGGSLAPENTLAGFELASVLGHRGVEFDVMLASDGVPVLLHDDELGRTVAGSGSVALQSSEQLCALDAGSWFAASFANERVPTLQQALALLAARDLWMNVEIKPVPGYDERTGAVVAAAVQAFVTAHRQKLAPPLLSSFSEAALAAAQKAAPDLARALLVEAVPANWQERLDKLEAQALHVQHRHLTAPLLAQIQAAGYRVMAYTVNEPQRAAELLAWGVDAICTDRLDLLPPSFGVAAPSP